MHGDINKCDTNTFNGTRNNKKIGDNTDCTYRFDKNHFLKGVDHF